MNTPVCRTLRKLPLEAGWALGAVLTTLLAAAPSAMAQVRASGASAAGIYTCIDDRNRRLTADRPIAECSTRDQRVLNSDGSLKFVHPPVMTTEERAEKESRDLIIQQARIAQADAVRRDRNLVARYPNEELHLRAREASLDSVRLAMRASDARLKELDAERRPLQDDAEFYRGRTLPSKLQASLDAIDAAAEAQRAAATSQIAELRRINRLYDAELDRLRRLWAGAAAGSLGSMGGGMRGSVKDASAQADLAPIRR